MKELFNTKSTLFTECQNSIPSSRYSSLSTAGCGGNRSFPIWIAWIGLNNDFLDPKMVLDLIFDGFSCIYMVYIIQNAKIPDILGIFGNITWKRANFCQKWVPKLKIAISQNHIFVNNLRKKHARKLKFGQVMDKNRWKNVYISDFFYFWPHFEKNGLCMLQPITWPNFKFQF